MTSSREPGRHAAPDDDGKAARAPARALRHTPRRSAGPATGARRGFRIAAQVIAAVLSTAIVVGTGWAWHELRTFTDNVNVGSRVAAATGSATAGPHYVREDQNILLLGNDSREGATPAELADLGTQQDGGSSNTDTMLILHVPADGSRATAISFPRDSYVEIPGYGRAKLNSAYPDGYQTAKDQGANEVASESAGIQVLISTLSLLTGVHIDHYVQVNLLGFYRISIALQGVQVCLLEPAKEPNSGIDLKAGTQTIQGKQALAFVRQRYGFPDGQGDLDRIRRQQYFLSAVFRQTLSAGTLLSPSKLSNLLDAVSSSLLIDPDLDLLSLASQLSDLQAGNLNFYTAPTEGFDDDTPVGSVVVVDPEKVQAFVQSTFFPATVTPSPAAPTSGVPTTPAVPTDSTSPTLGNGSTVPTAVNAADAACIA